MYHVHNSHHAQLIKIVQVVILYNQKSECYFFYIFWTFYYTVSQVVFCDQFISQNSTMLTRQRQSPSLTVILNYYNFILKRQDENTLEYALNKLVIFIYIL